MDSMLAFFKAQGAPKGEEKVFDWLKAAQILAERKPDIACAGLQSDMEWTGGYIWRDGRPVPKEETYTYLASNWATPILEIDGEEIECYRMMKDVPEWNSATYWPEEALAVLKKD
jgi:hypothetical protein